jgi:hypothetical protein
MVARFDGGTISADGGAFLLRQTAQRLNLLPRLAECFLDGRAQNQIQHSIEEMLSQRSTAWRWVTKTSAITSNYAIIQSSASWLAGKIWSSRWRARAR